MKLADRPSTGAATPRAPAGITRQARADIRKLFKDGKLLPINRWPDDVADCVKTIKHTPFGPTVIMYDKLLALKLMAIAGGKLKPRAQRPVLTFTTSIRHSRTFIACGQVWERCSRYRGTQAKERVHQFVRAIDGL